MVIVGLLTASPFAGSEAKIDANVNEANDIGSIINLFNIIIIK